jgi:L-aminopeptidase/D-esterase-like protein
MIKVGKKNLITDVPGIRVGNVQDKVIRTGVTVIIPDEPAVASADIRGGGPGSRETEALNADCLVDVVHGIVLSGGSAYGLDAAGGVMASLRTQKRGFVLGVSKLGMLAADCVAQAIARGVFQAERMGDLDSYRDRYGR